MILWFFKPSGLKWGNAVACRTSDAGNRFGRIKKSRWFSTLTGGPSGPASPAVPGGPLGPGLPIDPFSPFKPSTCLPGGPGGPGSPECTKSLSVPHVRELGSFRRWVFCANPVPYRDRERFSPLGVGWDCGNESTTDSSGAPGARPGPRLPDEVLPEQNVSLTQAKHTGGAHWWMDASLSFRLINLVFTNFPNRPVCLNSLSALYVRTGGCGKMEKTTGKEGQ